MDKLPMTAEGLKSLEDELKRLRGEERPAVIKAIEVAREHGERARVARGPAALPVAKQAVPQVLGGPL